MRKGVNKENILKEDDRILISYGGETEDEIEEQLKELDSQIINKK